ncbi:YcaO-like family protein [Rhodobacter sp. KR11]|uniref:YcaO-like family protein n=1 Tax=Rhodobacter sp. KR11 TaxID=2974588 RepID=UPI002223917D|nr:YcaO-like family protein [Rhodobacter sp. KR11]MCW1920577.1 YcaO-like family protein [Rhodobacter sp. KR11]
MTETLARLTRALADDFQLVPLELADCPVFLAAAWPLREGVTGARPRLPAGRGLTPLQALISTGAEAVELRASLAQHHLPSVMVPARDLLSGQIVPVPAQRVYLDWAATLGEPLICDATSTGCAAGATGAEATLTALWECIERDALALWWYGGAPAAPLALDLIDRTQPRLNWWLEARPRVTRLYDLTTDIGLPVVAAVSSDPDGRNVALGSAARPLRAEAALSAVTEMIQTEAAMEMARQAQDPECQAWDAFASTEAQPQFRPLAQARPDLPGDVLQRLADLGHRALAIELTLPGDPMPTMRVLVPGLCAMGGAIDTGIDTARFRRLCPAVSRPIFPEPY